MSVNLKIGEGVYNSRDLSLILSISRHKARYWFKQYLRDKFLPFSNEYTYHEKNDLGVFVNFKMLLQFVIFDELKDRGFSTNRIIEWYHNMSRALDTKYPLIEKPIFTSGKDILLKYEGEYVDDKMQLNFKEIALEFAKKIEFDSVGTPIRFYPLGSNRSIVIDPKVKFGAPTIKGTRIEAEAVYELRDQGVPIKEISKIYNLDIRQVKDAINYFKAA